MTSKEKVINRPKLFGFQFNVSNNRITINSNKPLIFDIDFSENEVKIKAHLKGWNFLTGLIEMDFEKVLTYILVWIVMLIILLYTAVFLRENPDPLYLLVTNAVVMLTFISQTFFYINYRIKYEAMKSRIMFCIAQGESNLTTVKAHDNI